MSAALPSNADVVVIGGGIMGASIAWQLARGGAASVVLIERDIIAAGASGRTGALLRQHYTNIPEATLASRSLLTFRHWNDVVGGDCGFVESGLIVTIPTLDGFQDNVERMRSVTGQLKGIGVAIEMVDSHQLRELDPAAHFDDVAFATFEPESGYVDAIAATLSMVDAAVRAGTVVLEETSALKVQISGSRITSVETTRGVVNTDRVVLACGPWTPAIASAVGVELPITAQRVQVAIFQHPSTCAASTRTYVDNVGAIFCRPWGPGRIMAGLGGGELHDRVDPDRYDAGNDRHFPEMARSAMANRFPGFSQARFLHGHAGLYDMTPDGHPIIAEAELDGLWIVAGFSGAGFKKGPAVGAAVGGAIQGRIEDIELLAPFRLNRDWQQPWSPYEYRLAHDFGHGF